MIAVTDLTVSFGAAAALRNVTLTISPGERLGIVGESGSGKSMLGLSLMGMVPEAATVSGSIRIKGRELSNAPERLWRRFRAKVVAMVFQEPLTALNPLLRVGTLMGEVLRHRLGLSRGEARERALALLSEVGLPEVEARINAYPHELSGGQRQRVLIALALACAPSVLIADEPTTALDAQVAVRILDLLVALAERRGMALVLISHDFAAVARATERIAVLYGGEIVELGPTKTVLSKPRHPYTQALIAARPLARPAPRDANGRRLRLPTIPGTVPALVDLPQGCRFAGRCPVELPLCKTTPVSLAPQGPGHFAACHRLVAHPARLASETLR